MFKIMMTNALDIWILLVFMILKTSLQEASDGL